MEIIALKVQQWLDDWNEVKFDNARFRHEPNPKHFYVFSINANLLKRLSKVYPRDISRKKRAEDPGIQRIHDPKRSDVIRQYIFGGFPWSDLSEQKRRSDEYKDLKMPGWLPTAIIANIIAPGERRGNETINENEVVKVEEQNSLVKLILPEGADNPDWDPIVAPIEIIDGQHRLWAFEKDEKLNGNYELPVVAFYNLDISWQAYLFYTINIKPKKINASLAYDLYPLLRTQDWLEKAPEYAHVYRETRAQELTEILWAHEKSPWRGRINMLGEGRKGVSQAAFVRSLTTAFIKSSSGKSTSIGGLFGSFMDDNAPLAWNRAQQAGLLIYSWRKIAEAIKESNQGWCQTIRNYYNENQEIRKEEEIGDNDLAFASKYSLLATDQGVRGFSHIVNDMLFVNYKKLDLSSIVWNKDEVSSDTIDHSEVNRAINEFSKHKVGKFLTKVAANLVNFDWRTSSFPNLPREIQQKQMVFKGSSGYKELRKQLLEILSKSDDKLVSVSANEVLKRLDYVN